MYHIPIMADDVIRLLSPSRGGVFVDGTLGGGGHSQLILKSLPQGSRLIGIDLDSDAIKESSNRLNEYGEAMTIIKGNFFDMAQLLSEQGIEKVDGILLDLGVSSHQLDACHRGFSYHQSARLDMRMDQTRPFSAYELVNTYPSEELTRVFRDYGEERYAKRLANAIVAKRSLSPIESTTELADIIKEATPPKKRFEGKHPARRVFQAIRIEVNAELDGLREAIERAVQLLNSGGVIAIISFHSLEDRVVKQCFRRMQDPCTCAKGSPICVCEKKPVGRLLTRKPIEADEAECERNNRARSAKLRALQRL